MKKLLYILLFTGFICVAQSPLVLASQQQASPSNLYWPSGNAASDDDTASIAFFNQLGSATRNSEAVAGEGNVVNIVATGATFAWVGGFLTVPNSTLLTWEIRYRVISFSTGLPYARNWSGAVTSPTFALITDGAWHTETFTYTSNATSTGFRFYTNWTAGSLPSRIQIASIKVY